MKQKKQTERYPLTQSPFYRMGRAVDLASLLGVTPKNLRSLIVRQTGLYYFRDECINGKMRSLAVPIGEMRAVHERIKNLLGRIALADYLYSPRRGRAPVDNAAAHKDAASIVKLDVKQFYPSTTDEHVFQFFRHRLGMADDVAGRVTKLCTVNGKVPFGSPLTPILCALVHDDIFSKAASGCQQSGDTMSLWVDDIAISGASVAPALVHDVRRLVASKGMQSHKTQRMRGRDGAVVTGTFVGPKGLAPANKSHLKMKMKLAELRSAELDEQRLKIVRSLIGLVQYFMTIFAAESDGHQRLAARLAWLHNSRRDLERAITGAALPASVPIRPHPADGSLAPWV